jgi:hypothetical protein
MNTIRKIIPLLLVFIMALNFIHPAIKAHAMGETAVLKLAVGSEAERIMFGIAEKAGVKFADSTALSKAEMRWNYNLEYHARVPSTDTALEQKLSDLPGSLNNIPLVADPKTPGWSKAIISGAMFLTGADLLYEAYNAFQDGYNKQQFASIAGTDLSVGNYYTSGLGFSIPYFSKSSTAAQYQLYNKYKDLGSAFYGDVPYLLGTEQNYYKINSKNGNIWNISVILAGMRDGAPFYSQTKTGDVDVTVPLSKATEQIITPYKPTQTDVPTVTVPSALPATVTTPTLGNYTVPSDFPESVTVYVPDTVPDPSTVVDSPNVPIGQTEPAPAPDPLPDSSVPIDDTKCTKPLDMSKMKHLGTEISTSFPFSIPWDIYNAFDSVFGGMTDSGKPDWVFKFSAGNIPIVGNTFHFTVPNFFDNWIPFVHGVILIGWNVGIIYALRKWFGGAS